MLKKNNTLLWALTEQGIVIQNLQTNVFYELNSVEEKVWSYIDGTHTEEEIKRKVVNEFPIAGTKEIVDAVDKVMILLKSESLVI